uniref:Uncharacterized protein n=1 Tax=Arundo donax TaxID=35708 RepID=A0A0A8Z6J4_ARUDO
MQIWQIVCTRNNKIVF